MNKPPYQVDEATTVSHLGFTYRLNPLLRLGSEQPTDYLHVSELRWQLNASRRAALDAARVAQADLRAPLLVLQFGGKLFVLDGIYRLARATDELRYMLPCKVLSPVHLREEFLIPSQENIA